MCGGDNFRHRVIFVVTIFVTFDWVHYAPLRKNKLFAVARYSHNAAATPRFCGQKQACLNAGHSMGFDAQEVVMSESEMKAEVARLRAENARLQELTQSSVRVDKRLGKDGKTWISVKGIPGTGWGISAEPRGWTVFLQQFAKIEPQVKALL